MTFNNPLCYCFINERGLYYSALIWKHFSDINIVSLNYIKFISRWLTSLFVRSFVVSFPFDG